MTPKFTTLVENEISEEPKVIEEVIDLQSATEEGVPIIMPWDLLSFNFKKLSLNQLEIWRYVSLMVSIVSLKLPERQEI